MVAVLVLGLGSLAFILFAMVRAVVKERTDGRPIWHEFGLGIALMLLFFGTWVGHGIAQWQVFTDEQAAHNQPVEAGNFVAEFASASLENWQSEFLQLFAFVVLASVLLFKRSAESRDSDEKLEAALRRLEEKLGTLPDDAPQGPDAWELPDAPEPAT
jgi:hypothetical protein